MIAWQPFVHAGIEYELSHLHPRWFTFVQPAKGNAPAREYQVHVTYGLHCFTRGRKGEPDDHPLCYRDSRETRLFDFRRYALSRGLSAIVESLPRTKCFHTNHGNFFIVTRVDAVTGAQEEYEVYFDTSRSKERNGALNLFVQSAFVRDQAHQTRPKRKPIGFFVVLYNRQKNKVIVPAPG